MYRGRLRDRKGGAVARDGAAATTARRAGGGWKSARQRDGRWRDGEAGPKAGARRARPELARPSPRAGRLWHNRTMRRFLLASALLHTLLFAGVAFHLRPGKGLTPTNPLPAPEVNPFASRSLPPPEVTPTRRERIEFDLIEPAVRQADTTTAAGAKNSAGKTIGPGSQKSRPSAAPGKASGFRLQRLDGYQITIAPSYTGAGRGSEKPAVREEGPAAAAGPNADAAHMKAPTAAPAPGTPPPPGFVPEASAGPAAE